MKETLYAKQEQQGGLAGLAVVAVVIGGVIFLNRRGSGANGGSGNGGGEVPAGMASVAGQISGVTVQQQAPMGQLEKAVQSSLIVEMGFNGGTTKDGAAISWPYYVVARIGHSTLFGWKEAGSSGIPDFRDLNGNIVQMPWASSRIDTATSGRVRLPTLRIPNDPGVTWDVHVQLRAQESDAFGSPNGTWMDVGPEFKEDGAFIITQASAPASVAGSISTVTVAQPSPGERLPLPSSNRQGLRLTGRR